MPEVSRERRALGAIAQDAIGTPDAALGREPEAWVSQAARLLPYLIMLGGAYYVAALIGLGFRFQNSQIGVVWPANAVLVSALLIAAKSRWWAVLAVTALAHALAIGASVPAWRLGWQIAGNWIFAVVTVEVLRRTTGLPLHFENRRQVLAFTIVSFVMPAVFSFTTPAFVRSQLNLEPDYSPVAALLRTTMSNATAMLLVVPVIVPWAQHGLRRLGELHVRRLYEAILIIIALVAAGFLAFGTGPGVARFPSLLLLVLPPLLWAAIRFGPTGASTSLFCVAALSMIGTARQLGPFVLIDAVDQVLSLQLFWIVLCPTVMLVAAAIRERDQAERALQDQRNHLAHVTRVATAGELSGALAHELRQPLTSILANAQAALHLLRREPVDLTEVREILEDIEQQDKQAADVIARLRQFLKEGEARFELLAVETVVRDALALGRSTIQMSGVDVQTRIDAGLPRVHGDAVQLLQVVLNLVVNGCEAMNSIPVPDRHLRLELARRDPEHVEVLVADSGVGLPGGSDDKVFEPFFTTKATGLGLGLAIARSIAAAHGGRLWGENNLERGAAFHLLLPTVQGGPRAGSRGART